MALSAEPPRSLLGGAVGTLGRVVPRSRRIYEVCVHHPLFPLTRDINLDTKRLILAFPVLLEIFSVGRRFDSPTSLVFLLGVQEGPLLFEKLEFWLGREPTHRGEEAGG